MCTGERTSMAAVLSSGTSEGHGCASSLDKATAWEARRTHQLGAAVHVLAAHEVLLAQRSHLPPRCVSSGGCPSRTRDEGSPAGSRTAAGTAGAAAAPRPSSRCPGRRSWQPRRAPSPQQTWFAAPTSAVEIQLSATTRPRRATAPARQSDPSPPSRTARPPGRGDARRRSVPPPLGQRRRAILHPALRRTRAGGQSTVWQTPSARPAPVLVPAKPGPRALLPRHRLAADSERGGRPG